MRILTVNAGSSSLKWALYHEQTRMVGGAVSDIGTDVAEHAVALESILASLGVAELAGLSAVGHRVVHGGPNNPCACRVTPALLGELAPLAALDPDHMPAALAIIAELGRRLPGLPQVACFDTAFFTELPRIARVVAIPRRFESEGVRRYGFHGLSYTWLMQEMRRIDANAAGGRLVLAHLGSGASLAAMRDGSCVETTMGFTPTSGLVMGTRSGDIDPGVVIRLLRMGISVEGLDDLLNHQSGLLGVSGTSADMRELLAVEAIDPHAAEAVSLFCYQATKSIGALTTTIGGLETLVFSGGIGENAPQIRSRIAERLVHLGVEIDSARNDDGLPVISTDASRCTIRVARTDEESIIASQTMATLVGDISP